MNDVPHQSPETLTKELLDYWLKHAENVGTMESIVEWWLLEHRIQQAATEVRVVMEKLVAKGFVVQQQQADRRIYYQLNPDKEAEARAWLESGGKTD